MIAPVRFASNKVYIGAGGTNAASAVAHYYMPEFVRCGTGSDAGESESYDAEFSDSTLLALRYHELADLRKDGRKS